ncbi:MAG: amidohydrolase family protein, partial [Gammaproteobacteria bacterium]|nr:amidohydrolase family protein [Gammaproteobacteria bacterium]
MEIGARGELARVDADARDAAGARRLPGPVLPGMPNLHSHAFQRAMAGLTERRGRAGDDFWTWRETMYRFVSRLTPELIEAVAAQLYVEMLEAGYTSVAEFHYLHHDTGGNAYADIAETSNRIVGAAATAGIFLCHLPVVYERAGFDDAPLSPGQRRFANDADQYCRLLDAVWDRHADRDQVRIGIALHSLRAVGETTMNRVLEYADTRGTDLPVHIHVAEQVREVEHCVARLGARPIQWLYDHAAVDRRWCLVHATH